MNVFLLDLLSSSSIENIKEYPRSFILVGHLENRNIKKIDISKIFTESFPMEEFYKHCSIEGQSMNNLSVFMGWQRRDFGLLKYEAGRMLYLYF